MKGLAPFYKFLLRVNINVVAMAVVVVVVVVVMDGVDAASAKTANAGWVYRTHTPDTTGTPPFSCFPCCLLLLTRTKDPNYGND